MKKNVIFSLKHAFWFFSTHSTDRGFPGRSDGKEYSSNAGNPGSITESQRFSEVGNGNPLQYSCLDNSMDRGALQASPLGRKELDTAEQLSMYTVSEDPGGRRFGVPSVSA